MGKKITFWILFPLISLLLTAIIVFYLDLANGPLVIFILELVVIVAAITMRIILRNKKFVFRMIPFLAFVVLTAILLPLAKPSTQVLSAGVYGKYHESEVLELANGKVKGLVDDKNEIQVYAGIPYAKAPVGELRWKEPQDVENWEGIKDCSNFGPRAMQNDTSPIINTLVDIYSCKSWHPDYTMHPNQNMSEDCLYLNIWRPNNNETNLPILVYIHGGSLNSGSTSFGDYNGEEMARKGIIMISIQYRLGVFGYFAHQQLIDESVNNTTGNYGLLDQIKALKWINDNATYFGGDKNNITIAGESAGSSSVSALCTSPLAAGLFKRAIGESSSLVVKIPPHTYRTMEKAQEVGQQIMADYNCSTIEELRNVSADKLVAASEVNTAMTLDGYALIEDPYTAYVNHHNNEEALLNGYNILESDAFVIPQFLFSPTNKNNIRSRLNETFGEVTTNKIMTLYADKIEQDAFTAFNEIFSIYWFIQPHHSWSNMALNNGLDVYRYQFTKENGYHGTYHSGEIVYCYGNIKHAEKQFAYNQSDYDLAETMSSYWVNFVKSGNPNGAGLPTWNKYSSSTDKVMELGDNVGPIDDKYLQMYTIIDEYLESQLGE